MLDLETFGTRPGSVLRSIGACAFTFNSGVVAEFYRNIDYISCLEAGLTVDPATKKWWSEQAPEAEAALLVDPQQLFDVVNAFHLWFLNHGGVHIWCHGANFDEPLWVAAARSVGLDVPWKFWNVRCTRTCFFLQNFEPRSIKRAGTHHNALDDAKYQVMCVQAAMRGKMAIE
jgi:hypothetical protein